MSEIPMTPLKWARDWASLAHVASVPPMTTKDTTPDERESVTEESAEINVAGAGGNIMVPVEEAQMEISEIQPVEGGRLVDISLRNDCMSIRMLLKPDEAEKIGRELAKLEG